MVLLFGVVDLTASGVALRSGPANRKPSNPTGEELCTRKLPKNLDPIRAGENNSLTKRDVCCRGDRDRVTGLPTAFPFLSRSEMVTVLTTEPKFTIAIPTLRPIPGITSPEKEQSVTMEDGA